MRFGPIAIERAEGKILGHNVAGPDGRRRLRKGRPLSRADVEALREMGRAVVYVAELGPGDVDEDTAARRIAAALVHGPGLRLSGPATGRVNLLAEIAGVLHVDAEELARVNACEGVTLATLAGHSVVRPGQMAATVKILPYALDESLVARAEAAASERGPILRIDPFRVRSVGWILSGSPSVREKLSRGFLALRERIEAMGASITADDYVPLEDEEGERRLAETLGRFRAAGVELILLAGETAIMDRHDIAPRALERAGGEIECVGAPVDPGNLLMLGYLSGAPVVGAPGCARSRKVNVVDAILPRLMAGERLRRSDVIALGEGGLLEDVPERPLPRSRID